MALLLNEDPVRISCSADVLDTPTPTPTMFVQNQSVRINDLIFRPSNTSASASSEEDDEKDDSIRGRRPIHFRSDSEIIRQIPKLTIDMSSIRQSATTSTSSRKMMVNDATKTTPTTPTTPTLCRDDEDEYDDGEKVGQKRTTRISFEAHPLFCGQHKRKTRISCEVHPFLVFDDDDDAEE
ncbi:hypothetical protein ACHAXH_005408 [Discostella pseudostelligera]|jgi:hypothetical protein